MMKFTRLLVSFLLSLCLIAPWLAAQQGGVDLLLSKARSLEARGRMDLAVQNWKQILLANPNQPEALAGLARYAKQNGNAEEERAYLDRLRKADPKSPEIAAIEKMRVLTQPERDRLDEAGRLTMQGKPEQAMKIYVEVFGSEPPVGKWAGPYYEAEAATTGGRQKAIAELRRLSERNRTNELYRLWLARVLVYDPKTRMEGFQLLESIHDPGTAEGARAVWRQALLWEKENPAALQFVNAYLERYPDPQLHAIQQSLEQERERLQQEASKEQAFQALRNQDMTGAETRFQEVLRRSPNDPNAVAGMAFVRLHEKRFDEAVALFDRARALSPQRADVRAGYATAKFWSLIGQGSAAVEQNRPDAAIALYQQALALRPQDQQAMLGIAQAEVRENRLADAEAEFHQVLAQSPDNLDALAGLAFIQLDRKKFDDALAYFEKARLLARNRPDIAQGYQSAKYFALMQHAADAAGKNQLDLAVSDYQQALQLRPGSSDALHGLAGASERRRDYAGTVQAYTQLAASNPADLETWLGLIRGEMAAKNYPQILRTAQSIPPAVESRLEARSDYLSALALADFYTNQSDAGDRMLGRAMDAAAQSDTPEALNFRLEVAGQLITQPSRRERALEVYRQAARLHPENAVPWQALVGAYVEKGDFGQAKAAVGSIPQTAYANLAGNNDFLNTVALIYSAEGDCNRAEDFLNRSLSLDKARGRLPRESTQLQLADIWLRERNYAKARQQYHDVLSRDQNSAEAWRGYLTALHDVRDDRALVAEGERMPAAVRVQLESKPEFLALLAGAHSTLGQAAVTVQLLERARTLYESQHQVPPPDLDVQLAWAMLDDPQGDPRPFFEKARARKDLAAAQRATIEEIWSDWNLHAADTAFSNKRPDEAISILADALRLSPNNPKLYGALASAYAREHNYRRALEIYASWTMTGARAADYRAAAGAALAVHKNELVNGYLEQGLRRFPDDPDLLEMRGKQEVARGNYEQGQSYLKRALKSARSPLPQAGDGADNRGRDSLPADTRARRTGSAVAGKQPTACQETTRYRMPGDSRWKLENAAYRERDETGDAANGGDDAAQSDGGQAAANHDPPNENAAASAANLQNNAERQQQIQDEIDAVQNRNTPYSEFANAVSGRAGDPGFNRLIVEDSSLGGSITGANTVRLSVFARGLYLASGTPDGRSKSRFGTLGSGAAFGSQSTGGLGGEIELSTATFGLNFGATPSAFPVQNLTGGVRFRAFNGPIIFSLVRDSVKDSLLSYAGVRDPGTGIVWGGVVSNTGTAQFDRKTTREGEYATVGFSYLTGQNVANNWNAFGNAGFYVVVAKGLSVGLSVAGMHYDKNLSFFSLGQGGYFSPQEYGLAALPVSWFSRHRRFEYEIRASLGAQYIGQDSSPYFPARVNAALPSQGFYAGSVSTGPNYSFLGRLGFRLSPHLYLDTFAAANNARNYATQSVGFSLKFLAHPLPTNSDLHVNSIPDWKGNQPFAIQ